MSIPAPIFHAPLNGTQEVKTSQSSPSTSGTPTSVTNTVNTNGSYSWDIPADGTVPNNPPGVWTTDGTVNPADGTVTVPTTPYYHEHDADAPAQVILIPDARVPELIQKIQELEQEKSGLASRLEKIEQVLSQGLEGFSDAMQDERTPRKLKGRISDDPIEPSRILDL